MVELENFKKFILEYIPDCHDDELYNAINNIKDYDDGLSMISVRGVMFYYSTFTYSLDHVDYGVNPPVNVGLDIYEDKTLDKLIKSSGYEFK